MHPQKIIVVVGGNAGHGKDTLADMLSRLLPDARRDAYAAPLKVCVYLKTGIPMDILNGPVSVKNDPRFGRYGKSPRKLMQEEGEEARQRIGLTVWMDRLRERALAEPERITVVSDGRHPEEEFDALRSSLPEGSLFFGVRVVRPSVPVDISHVSESRVAAAPDSLFNAIVLNEGTIADLEEAAQQLADAIVLRAKGQTKAPKGWIVRCPSGSRVSEAFANAAEAAALAGARLSPCPVCRTGAKHEVEATKFDRLTLL